MTSETKGVIAWVIVVLFCGAGLISCMHDLSVARDTAHKVENLEYKVELLEHRINTLSDK